MVSLQRTEHDICLLRLRFNHFGAVEIAVLELEAGIVLRYGRRFVAVSYQASKLIFRMSIRDLVDAIATNITR